MVTESMTAIAVGNPTAVPVLGTPIVLGWFEVAAAEALAPFLDASCVIVGAHVTLNHTSPTPVGFAVEITAQLQARHGNKFTWDIVATDSQGEAAHGTLISAVIPKEALNRRIRQKEEARSS
ncbi:hypothetical protein BXT84_14435 [Sulfobacillus thermotolerans]|uniref:Fluoroacetyl-CoA-specific thioesterase-like domain-containing protein n=2 Tax=Clostridiales Family XVII. Incertae Sedis TaxID=539000 RepID=A0ABM6RVT2_9FIRM|nr:hypothetical protein BXT84_14435 [Sulfobacillus thermotolerans]